MSQWQKKSPNFQNMQSPSEDFRVPDASEELHNEYYSKLDELDHLMALGKTIADDYHKLSTEQKRSSAGEKILERSQEIIDKATELQGYFSQAHIIKSFGHHHTDPQEIANSFADTVKELRYLKQRWLEKKYERETEELYPGYDNAAANRASTRGVGSYARNPPSASLGRPAAVGSPSVADRYRDQGVFGGVGSSARLSPSASLGRPAALGSPSGADRSRNQGSSSGFRY